ncbi:HAD family hydrolase [Granulicatella sp.]
MTIKHIFCDMDGTLLNSNGQVNESNAALIREAGIPVTLVSARAPMEMRDAINALQLKGAQVAFNGGLIYTIGNHNQVVPIHAQTIKINTVKQLLKGIRQHFPQVSLSYYDLNKWYCDKIDDGIQYEQNLTRQAPTIIDSEEQFLEGQANTFKIMMISFDEESIRELEKYLQSLYLPEITIQRSGKAYLEITHLLAKKSQGISHILRKEQLVKEETAAFGDGHNDLPMLEMVGYPIVMDNAFDDIKAIAYKITKSNDEDGVGYGIHKYLK